VTIDPETVQQHKDTTFNQLQQDETMRGDEDGNLTLKGERFNIMGADYFMADILDLLAETYGSGAGGILRETGEEYGQDLLDLLDTGNDLEEALGGLLGLLRFLGYSDPHVNNDSIEFPSSPTAVEHLKKDYDSRRTCYFLSGILTGAAQQTDTPVRFVEEQCRADGDETCLFRIQD
jgi:predicted hydrocarbon binding protein